MVKDRRPLFFDGLRARALERIDEIRLAEKRRGPYGRIKAYTINWIAAQTGINALTIREWLVAKRNRIPVEKLDKIMAALDIDVLDLLQPSEVGDAYLRGDFSFRAKVRKRFKQNLPSKGNNLPLNMEKTVDIEGKTA